MENSVRKELGSEISIQRTSEDEYAGSQATDASVTVSLSSTELLLKG